ncbi:RTA1-domain-containing protein, partial [Panus rudis PR-1116 ss-1]
RSPYGYVPTLWICALYVALFSLTTLIHVVQAGYYRLWFLYPTVVLGGIAEIIGWAGRLWSSKNPPSLNPFLMQITTTIIAPTPLVAANFVILGQLIQRLGPMYSRLSAMWYTILFVTCDIVALVVQAVGGAKASIAVQNGQDPNPGGHIMLGGIAFQLGSITIYMLLAGEFVLRYLYNRPLRNKAAAPAHTVIDRKIGQMLFGLAFSSITIFIRSVYRTIELQDGWTGRIIGTQRYFNWLDGAMITLAFFCHNFFHPGRLLG